MEIWPPKNLEKHIRIDKVMAIRTKHGNYGSIQCTDSRVELPITDPYLIIEDFFRSYVLHFE
jgi:hypothetical protein